MAAGALVVIGSVNYDLTFFLNAFPGLGQSVLATGHTVGGGGKGANQALQAALLGTDVKLVARVGHDAFADLALARLRENGVDTQFVIRDSGAGTGLGCVWVDASGENKIVIAPEANARLSRSDVTRLEPVISSAGAVLTELETPTPASLQAFEYARANEVLTIVNASPAAAMTQDLMAVTDLLVCNEGEARELLADRVDLEADPLQLAQALTEQGPKVVAITLSARGSVLVSGNESFIAPALEIGPVSDPTGAGDAYCGALSAALASSASLSEALRLATAAGAVAASQVGAQSTLGTAQYLGDIARRVELRPLDRNGGDQA